MCKDYDICKGYNLMSASKWFRQPCLHSNASLLNILKIQSQRIKHFHNFLLPTKITCYKYWEAYPDMIVVWIQAPHIALDLSDRRRSRAPQPRGWGCHLRTCKFIKLRSNSLISSCSSSSQQQFQCCKYCLLQMTCPVLLGCRTLKRKFPLIYEMYLLNWFNQGQCSREEDKIAEIKVALKLNYWEHIKLWASTRLDVGILFCNCAFHARNGNDWGNELHGSVAAARIDSKHPSRYTFSSG